MTALQQSINVALSLGLPEAAFSYDLVDEVVVTLQRGEILFGELTQLRADLLENDLLGLGTSQALQRPRWMWCLSL